MVDELQKALDIYLVAWRNFTKQRKDAEFFASLHPISVGWKVADQAAYTEHFAELQTISKRVTGSWLDERWLGGFYTKDELLPEGIRHIKLMQRRPAKPNDSLGLDHVDFLLPEGIDIEQLLRNDPEISWEREKGDLCEWISVRFGNNEAKLRFVDKTSFDAVIKEWQIIKNEVTGA